MRNRSFADGVPEQEFGNQGTRAIAEAQSRRPVSIFPHRHPSSPAQIPHRHGTNIPQALLLRRLAPWGPSMSPYIPPVVRFDQVRPAPIRWLWKPYLARGKLAILDGDAGVGKSFFTADLAARLSHGGRMPDGSWRRRKSAVLFLNAEDGLDDTLRPRLEAAGADLTRVYSLGGIRLEDPAGGMMFFPQHLDCLRQAAVAHGPELIVIDPMMAFFPPEVSTNNDQSIRLALAPLAALAAQTAAAVLLVRQLTKRAAARRSTAAAGPSASSGRSAPACFWRGAQTNRRNACSP